MEIKKTLNEFRKQLASDTESVVNEINNIIPKEKVSESFKNTDFEFSWSALTGELKKYDYIYSQSEKVFINKSKEEEKSKPSGVMLLRLDKENIDKKYDKRVNFYLSDETKKRLDNIKNQSSLMASEFYDTLVNYALDKLEEEMQGGC